MKKMRRFLPVFTATLLLGFSNALMANAPAISEDLNTSDMATPLQSAPKMPHFTPPAPSIEAKAYVLMDADSGRILAAKDGNVTLPPASLTKLMTLYVVSQALQAGQLKLTDPVTISEKAWRMTGSRMFVKAGSQVAIEDLLKGIIVDSGNDACVAVAEHLAGNEDTFAALMNQVAQTLGMQHSHFLDSTGLPNAQHYTTARDMAILAQALIHHFPQDYDWFKEKWFTYNKIRQSNRNRLLWRDTSVDGLKTGHTKEAGFCLVASAKRANMRLISVVLGAPSDSARASDSEALLNYGFRFFETHKLFDANTTLAQERVWLGTQKKVNFGLARDFYVTIPTGDYQLLKANMELNKPLQAPVVHGQNYGQVAITLNGNPVATAPLVALQDSAPTGAWGRLTDHIAMTFHRFLHA